MKELGKGATAKVYLVQRKSDGKYFAAKIMSLKDSDNKDYVLNHLSRILLLIRLKS